MLYYFHDVPTKNKRQRLTNAGTFLNNNVVHIVDSDNENEKWICINKECVYHVHKEDNMVFTKNVDDDAVVDDENEKWMCINKYHNHIVDYDDENEKWICVNKEC